MALRSMVLSSSSAVDKGFHVVIIASRSLQLEEVHANDEINHDMHLAYTLFRKNKTNHPISITIR